LHLYTVSSFLLYDVWKIIYQVTVGSGELSCLWISIASQLQWLAVVGLLCVLPGFLILIDSCYVTYIHWLALAQNDANLRSW